jgi:hypothetical protein
VGFPAQANPFFGTGDPDPGMETNEVMAKVFGMKFGVKKLAPGQVNELPGALAGDINNCVFSHDASTLGGNSGSCIVDFMRDGTRVIGLHFAGMSRKRNYAHSLAALRDHLAPLGVKYV